MDADALIQMLRDFVAARKSQADKRDELLMMLINGTPSHNHEKDYAAACTLALVAEFALTESLSEFDK